MEVDALSGYTRRFIIVARQDLSTKANTAAHAVDLDPTGSEWFDVPISASGNLPAQAYWCSVALTTAMTLAIRTRLQQQGATVAETTPIAPGATPASTRFAIFDADDWTNPDDVLVAVGMQRIATTP